MTYTYREGSRFPVPPDAAGAELERIRTEHGSLKPSGVLEEARPVEAVLHPVFEWDDAAAAEHYRLQQARQLIRSVVVQATPEAEPRSLYVHVEAYPRSTEGDYVLLAEVADQVDQYAVALAEARKAVRSAVARVRELEAAGRESGKGTDFVARAHLAAKALDTALAALGPEH